MEDESKRRNKTKQLVPNRTQRHGIYRDALKAYRKMVRKYTANRIEMLGLCSIVKYGTAAWDKFGIDPYTYHGLVNLPELNSMDPNSGRSYWFPLFNTKNRIDILKKCIKLTAPKTKKK